MKHNKKQKPRGIKHKLREEKEREKRIGLAVTAAILITIISVSCFFVYSMLFPPSEMIDSTSGPKAAIVDQATFSPAAGLNQTFINATTNMLKQAEYKVDYYPGEKVTVDFYRDLPKHRYDVIVLRVHSAPLVKDGEEVSMINLFTSESFTTSRHIPELLADDLVVAIYYEGSPKYFGITPSFIKNRMKGTFNNATIIMMGCDGLKYETTAQAFIEKGAKVYIGWDRPVSSGHADAATINLLKHLITENQTITNAVASTTQEIGPDPTFEAKLLFYPTTAGAHHTQNTKQQKPTALNPTATNQRSMSKTNLFCHFIMFCDVARTKTTKYLYYEA